MPLDKAGRQEAWVPEFLFTVEKITGDEVSLPRLENAKTKDCLLHTVSLQVGADKWWKATVSPALPE